MQHTHAPALAGKFGWSLISTLWSPCSLASAEPQIFHLHCFWEVWIYTVSCPRQIKLMRDNKNTEHQIAKSKESFQCQVLNDVPFSPKCLQGDFYFFIIYFFLLKQTCCPILMLTWGISELLTVEEGTGDSTVDVTKASSSPCSCLCQPAWTTWGPHLTPWLLHLGPTPSTGAGRDFKVGAKHLRNLAVVPWSK